MTTRKLITADTSLDQLIYPTDEAGNLLFETGDVGTPDAELITGFEMYGTAAEAQTELDSLIEYRDMWSDDPEMVAEYNAQITDIRAYLESIA